MSWIIAGIGATVVTIGTTIYKTEAQKAAAKEQSEAAEEAAGVSADAAVKAA